MVPHLITSLSGPLADLEQRILKDMPSIERWFRLEWQEFSPPFYCSVDLRNSGFKIAAVDTNLFPGGFNNLLPQVLPLAVQASLAVIDKVCPDAKNLLLIPESHTRNQFYLQSIKRLCEILTMTGLNVRLGSIHPDVKDTQVLTLDDGSELRIDPVIRMGYENRRVGLKDFDPCTILLNNDLSSGAPAILEEIYEQTLLPPLHAGWHVRRKSNHFAAYDQIARKFARHIDIDHWMINPYFAKCEKIDFHAQTGLECVQDRVNFLLKKIKKKYKEYAIEQDPFIIMKADAGTYGMGVMTIKDPKDILELNRKERNKMSTNKEGLATSEVILQEGVYSIETINQATAEPVVYMMDRYVIGGFYRSHGSKSNNENLNSPGMLFTPLPFANHDLPNHQRSEHLPNRFYTYGVVARIALIAAALELEKTNPEDMEDDQADD
jgi:glutamate--cysteine ligase